MQGGGDVNLIRAAGIVVIHEHQPDMNPGCVLHFSLRTRLASRTMAISEYLLAACAVETHDADQRK